MSCLSITLSVGTDIKYGLQTLALRFFGGEPDIAVTGPNVGSNLGVAVLVSGTVGAATEAVKEGKPLHLFKQAAIITY
jgi:5'-nucleotidase